MMFKIISKTKLALQESMWVAQTAILLAKDKEIAELNARVRALEDAHEKSTGIKVRIDNTVVIAKFTKAETCVMQGAIYAYARSCKNMDDTKFAMALYDRMDEVIRGMKE